MTELEQLITLKKTQQKPVTGSTIKKYIAFYNSFSVFLGGRNIQNITEEELIQIIEKIDVGPCGKLNFLNIVSMIKIQHEQPSEKLFKYKELLQKKRDDNTCDKVSLKLNTLPPYELVRKFIDDLYLEEDYSRYLVNELIFTYGLRNVDVNAIIISLAEYNKIKKKEVERYERENWLVIKKKSVDFIVNRYKTKKSHGVKIIKIKNLMITDAVRKLGEGQLILSAKNIPVPDDGIHNYIKLYDLDGVKLTQSDYFKINIQYLQAQPNSLHNISNISKTRGTRSMDTLDKYYNLNNGSEDESI